MKNYQVPRGTQDVYGAEVEKWHYLEELIRSFTMLYDYQEHRTPVFEHTEVYSREDDSSDLVNKEMYTFIDKGERSITLRPEGTAGVMRSFVENKLYTLPLEVDEQIAALKLESMGIEIDTLTDAQREYLNSWNV